MKGKLIYITSFLAAFVFTTGLLVFLSKSYNNIFYLDFSEPKPAASSVDKKLNNDKTPGYLLEKKIIEKIADQKPNVDTLKKEIKSSNNEQVSSLIDSIKQIKPGEVKNITMSLTNSEVEQKPVTAEKKSSEVQEKKQYVEWTKKTAGLYEAMDPKRAAKIIQNYSDNVARDIIYAMKKKKAAEILSELSPETAQRITKIKE